MALTPLTFTPATGYNDAVTFPDPATEAAARAQIQELHDQTKTYIASLISELFSTANGKGISQLGVEDSAGHFTGTNGETVLAELATLLSTHTAATSWTAPTLLNSWVNQGAGYSPAGYHKDAHEYVHLKGRIKSGTTTSGTTLFNLPAGYRPALLEEFAVYSYSGSPSYGTMSIDNTGDVKILSGGNTDFSLAGITFKAEA